MLERRRFTAEDRARLAQQIPRLPTDTRFSQSAYGEEWVVDPTTGTYLLPMTRYAMAEVDHLYLLGYESRSVWIQLEKVPRHASVFLIWVRWEGLDDDSASRVSSLVKEAFCPLNPSQRATDVVVEVRDPSRPATKEEIEKSYAHALKMANELRFSASWSKRPIDPGYRGVLYLALVMLMVLLVLLAGGCAA